MPFLWILPLSIYLLTFILCFDTNGWYRRGFFLPLTALALGAMVYALTADAWEESAKKDVALFGASLFVCAMTCHGELARLKPHTRYLTKFYLMISAGGALGGVFVGLIAPHVFNAYYELPVAIVLCAILVIVVQNYDPNSPFHRARWGWMWIASSAAAGFLASILIWDAVKTAREYRVMARNFYSALKTRDHSERGQRDWARILTHGVINHGEQWLQPDRRREPTTYYGPQSGVVLALMENHRERPQRVGVTGLGAGVMLAHSRPGDYYRIYEINPQVLDIARTEFTFLKDSPAKVDVVMGDARLSMEREPPQNFDVMLMDAFSGDAVPTHLLTKEAFELYFRHLAPDGVLVMHVSNKYLDLPPVVQLAADALRKKTRVVDPESDDDTGFFGSTMVLVASQDEIFKRLALKSGGPVVMRPGVRLWTDDYSNLFRILK